MTEKEQEINAMIVRALRIVHVGMYVIALMLILTIASAMLRERSCPACAKCPTAERP